MLRLTGWLSLCHRVRDKRGGTYPRKYHMLHDELVNAFDAETLDPRWMDVLEKLLSQNKSAVRTVALRWCESPENRAVNATSAYQNANSLSSGFESIQTPEALADRQRILGRRHNSQPDKHKNRAQCKQSDLKKIELREKMMKNRYEKSNWAHKPSSIQGTKIELLKVRNGYTECKKYVRRSRESNIYRVPGAGLHQWDWWGMIGRCWKNSHICCRKKPQISISGSNWHRGEDREGT